MKYSRLNCLILLTEGVMSVECSLEMEVYKLLKNTNRKIKKELHEKLALPGPSFMHCSTSVVKALLSLNLRGNSIATQAI